jgi:hypothetical protein
MRDVSAADTVSDPSAPTFHRREVAPIWSDRLNLMPVDVDTGTGPRVLVEEHLVV